MSNRTIPQPGVLPKKPRLSVCMIVRDEEDMFSRCLKSVQSIADELIVVDTGSKDNTISIAKDFGAEVFHFKWRDDFAAARNESLKHATGDWILQMDADEELLSDSIPHLKSHLLRSMVLCYFIRCDNGPRCRGIRFGWFARLFRNHPWVRYSRVYHETVESSVGKLISKEPRWQVQYEPSIAIYHRGYEPSNVLKKSERGLQIMKSYLKKNPDDPYILSRLGGVCCSLERYDEAEAYLSKALEMNPDWSETNYRLGVTLERQKKLQAAIRYYKKAIATDPDFAEVRVNLGAIYIQKGMLDNAISELKKAVAVNPELALGHSNLGLAYKNKGMLDEAIAEFKKALAIDLHCTAGYINLGAAYHMKGMFDEAIAQYKCVLRIDANDADAHFNLAIAYYKKGNYKEAIKYCDRAVELGAKIRPQLLEFLKPYR